MELNGERSVCAADPWSGQLKILFVRIQRKFLFHVAAQGNKT